MFQVFENNSSRVLREVKAAQIRGYTAATDQSIKTAKPTARVNLFLSQFHGLYSELMSQSFLRPEESELKED